MFHAHTAQEAAKAKKWMAHCIILHGMFVFFRGAHNWQNRPLSVILSARRDEKLKEVAERCSNTYIAARTKLSILPYDASQLDRVKETVQAALSMANHRIDVLILNAGVYQLEPALSTSMETTQYLLRVNFESPVALATQVIRQDDWKSRGRGQIVAVTSLVARGPQSLTSSYAASKAALRNYLFTLSTEEAGWLQVNVALPGATRTNLWDSLDTGSTTNTDHAKANKRARDEVKMSPQRVARLILTGAAGPSLLFYEMFITKPIGLVWVYLSLYTPTLFYILVHVIGYIRVQLWNQTGSDTLDVPTLLKSTIDMLMGRL